MASPASNVLFSLLNLPLAIVALSPTFRVTSGPDSNFMVSLLNMPVLKVTLSPSTFVIVPFHVLSAAATTQRASTRHTLTSERMGAPPRNAADGAVSPVEPARVRQRTP